MARRFKPRDYLVAESSAMKQLLSVIELLSSRDTPVLIRGEYGTGRELIGRVLHCSGIRQHAEFIVVRAQMAPDVLRYEPTRCSSSQTLLAAQGGTLLIRDLGDVPRAAQERLYLLVQAHRAGGGDHDVRIVGTCDTELGFAAEAGLFHPELYEELGLHTIDVPPLRDRIEDIVPLLVRLVRQYAAELGRGRLTLSSRAHQRLRTYPWPGNVAELKRVARRAVIRASGGRIEPGDIDAVLPRPAERVPLEELSFEDMVRSKLADFLRSMDGYPLSGLYDDVLARVERPLFALVMEHTGGNQVRAAEILGLNRNTLRRKLSERGLSARDRAKIRTKSKGKARRRSKSQTSQKAG